MPRPPSERVVLRAGSGIVTLVIVGAVSLFLLIDALVRGALGVAFWSLPWLALVVWLVYLLLVRPCVVLEPAAISVVNVLRVHRIPWASVDGIRSRFQVRIDLVDGGFIRSWGAPTSGIDRPTAPIRGESARRDDSLPVHVLIDRWRADHESPRSSGRPTSRWDSLAVIVTLLLVVGAFAALAART